MVEVAHFANGSLPIIRPHYRAFSRDCPNSPLMCVIFNWSKQTCPFDRTERQHIQCTVKRL